ncbi:hypothetical protein EH31_07440 [Erythrobacter longus]|uniref:Uncharacterized protein n=1 Tax=Erythrobacter longus TaxID=1044 RepID=A0A074MYX6_ERYLO|nr:hypothetical protein EH31_07440 [Erythrobacter longus]
MPFGLVGINPGAAAREVLARKGPVELAVDNRVKIRRARIAVVDVIGVLPHIDGQKWVEAAVCQSVTIVGFFDRKLAVFFCKPNPTAGKVACAACFKLAFKLIHRTESFIDLGGKISRWSSRFAGE